ncbi:MAG: sigma-70 family RNA polymerase sigma factor [Prevotella sp.]|nr:sigma-70 family RNA polymerase sigma factor [Prevotella sp.]
MSKTNGTEEQRRIKKILDGQTGEYAFFVRTYSRQVLSLVSRMVADRSDAEELSQDVFVKAFQALASFDGRSSFSTWLMRIAYRTALNFMQRSRQQHISIDDLPLADTTDDNLDTGREERIQLLETLLEQLPPDDRLLLQLYYYDDRPLRDIAYIMDAEPNALAGRLYRIRKKLLLMIKQKEDETE